jgi:hypothetical protein
MLPVPAWPAILCFDSHAFFHGDQASLSIRPVINLNDALKAHTHHAVRTTGGAGHWGAPRDAMSGGQQCSGDAVALAGDGRHAVECE